MKILGVVFGVVDTEQDNWQSKLNKLKKFLNLWKSRSLSLFGKALVVNVLGLKKLIYLVRVLILPAWVLSSVNWLIWPFIWNSRMETVSRNTCYLKTQSGGLGLDNLDLRCKSLRLVGMASTLGSPRDSCFFLCKYFVGRRLSRLRPEWAFLRDNSALSAFSPSSFYDSCLSIPSETADTELSSKKVYSKQLLQLNSAGPMLSHHWAPLVSPAFQLSEHWSLVRDNFTENHKNDLLWPILLHAVKVRDSFENWGVIGSGVCACCPRLETNAHCFLKCTRVKRVWDYFSPLLSSLLGIQFDVNTATVFFFAWPSPCFKISRIARFLIKSIFYGI